MSREISLATLPQELEAHRALEESLAGIARDEKRLQLAMKRAIDLVGGVLLFALLLVPAVIIAVLIHFDSRGAPLLTQPRVGKNGRIFHMYKFRTMCQDAHAQIADLQGLNEQAGPIFKIRNDPRMTRVGRWLRKLSIDEVPQLLNVVRGDMSLVGPRPPLPHEVQVYTRHQLRRLGARPGLTGLWQVSGRSTINDFDTWLALDLEYVRRWSLWLDLRILAKTIVVVISARGAQ
jgi:lipopolysaccharide/colanic/teichoic acid biosynthesis glycosyltransferase